MNRVKMFGWTILVMSTLSSCKNERNDLEVNNVGEIQIDTLYSDEVLREYAGQFADYKSILKFNYLDKENAIDGLSSNDSIDLRVIYVSQKFPKLNENYEIHFYPVTKNFSFRKLSRNKFELLIESTTDMIEFDISLSCKGVIFKYGEFDKENNLTYVLKEQVFLGRFYEPVTMKENKR